jgi:hypothetical protein
MEIIEKYPEKPWVWDYISMNPNITMEFIEKHLEKPWVWDDISYNPNLTMDMIEKHPGKPWDWDGISQNKFTFENNKMKKKEGYLLLEKERSFHRLQNLYVINQYM